MKKLSIKMKNKKFNIKRVIKKAMSKAQLNPMKKQKKKINLNQK